MACLTAAEENSQIGCHAKEKKIIMILYVPHTLEVPVLKRNKQFSQFITTVLGYLLKRSCPDANCG